MGFKLARFLFMGANLQFAPSEKVLIFMKNKMGIFAPSSIRLLSMVKVVKRWGQYISVLQNIIYKFNELDDKEPNKCVVYEYTNLISINE